MQTSVQIFYGFAQFEGEWTNRSDLLVFRTYHFLLQKSKEQKSPGFGKCVNDVTFFQNFVIFSEINGLSFVL